MSTSPLDPDLARRWVRALRAGKYEQARGKLRERDGDEMRYCCMGVLLDVARPQGWDPRRASRHGGMARVRHTNVRLQFAGARVLEQVGLRLDDADKLSSLNDVRKLDFRRIADWIIQTWRDRGIYIEGLT